MDGEQRIALGVSVALGVVAIVIPSFFPVFPMEAAWFILGVAAMIFLWGVLPVFRSRSINREEAPASTIGGTGNVVSYGQSGGVTAGTYINQAVPPELHISDEKEATSEDGSHVVSFTARVDAPFTPGLLVVNVTAAGLKNVVIMPPDQDGFGSIRVQNVRRGPDSYSAEVPNPRGSYEFRIVTAERSPIEFGAHF